MMTMTYTQDLLSDPELLAIDDLVLIPNADLSNRTSMKTRSRAALLAQPESLRALQQLALLVRKRRWPMLILGGGSNTIFATNFFEGIVVVLPLKAFGGMEVVEDQIIRVGAASNLSSLMAYSFRTGMMGLEFCSRIPGTVGGAIAGNAGAGGWGLCDFVERALVMDRDGNVEEVKRGDFIKRYRYCSLAERIILEADIRLERIDKQLSQETREKFVAAKKGQPYGVPSSGCIFKNARDAQTNATIHAGKLIDEANLKGYRLNDVAVSDMHANFLVNVGNATGEDFLAMISLVKDIVYERSGIDLQIEARIVGGPMSSCVLG